MSLSLLSNMRSMLCLLSFFNIIMGALAADTLKGLVTCMNNEDCLGANRMCSHEDKKTEGRCTCKDGYIPKPHNKFACYKEVPRVTCENDDDCDLNEVCMSWQYDPDNDVARKLADNFHNSDRQIRGIHKLCIDTWILSKTFNNHLDSLDPDGPRTGGGLRSGVGRRDHDNFNADEYYFGGRRPPRVHQQYIGFAEDMMLILFLVCILATLVTVHRATCYRQFQEARRNTPLRHILPITEDTPPPYTNREPESVDGLAEVICPNPGPKPESESPPPSYEEALDRNNDQQPTLDAGQGGVPPPEDHNGSQGLIGEPALGQSHDPSLCPTHAEEHSDDLGVIPPVGQSHDQQSPDPLASSSTQDTQPISRPANSCQQEYLVTSSTGGEGRSTDEDNLQAEEETFALREENLVSTEENLKMMKEIYVTKEDNFLAKDRCNQNKSMTTEDSSDFGDQRILSEEINLIRIDNNPNMTSVETGRQPAEPKMLFTPSCEKLLTNAKSLSIEDISFETENDIPCSNPSSLDPLLPACVEESKEIIRGSDETLITNESVKLKTGSTTVEDVTNQSVITV